MSGRTAVARFRVDVRSVSRARNHTARVLREWRLGRVSPQAVLVTSELATNVVLHARGIGDYFELVLRRREGVLVVEVSDSYQWEMPELRKPAEDETSGRGLLLVDALAQAWGVRPRVGAGKTVWVHLALRGDAEAG
ncbi:MULTISPECIES: ATP-binding protein [Streptomyces]|uniref:ATP-binding protein n=1 Tax=Streptomyces albus TaxID=1888 RepID=A0A8H1QS28_9ACTN|nr:MULTISPECIES: ATP-binding protein [Streptomyces]TGG83335.1 ATP-binding protein [Streptomyces albus]